MFCSRQQTLDLIVKRTTTSSAPLNRTQGDDPDIAPRRMLAHVRAAIPVIVERAEYEERDDPPRRENERSLEYDFLWATSGGIWIRRTKPVF